jgi:hypothetical protein
MPSQYLASVLPHLKKPLFRKYKGFLISPLTLQANDNL